MSEVRSSELETRLSSSDDPVGEDTTVSTPRVVRAFSTLDEECGLDVESLSHIRNQFQFPERFQIRLPHKKERACHFSPEEVCFYETAFQSGLSFPIHPFIMEHLNHFKIAPRQLMPNSWRIIISYMEIWLKSTEGDMIRVDEFAYLYRLKESKEYEYCEFVPWGRKVRIITDLPSAFRYWKSLFFFVSRDDWETFPNEVWGDIPRLFHRWRASSLGASFLFKSLCTYAFVILFSSSLTFLFVMCSYKVPKA